MVLSNLQVEIDPVSLSAVRKSAATPKLSGVYSLVKTGVARSKTACEIRLADAILHMFKSSLED
jgi:hypothetical protein